MGLAFECDSLQASVAQDYVPRIAREMLVYIVYVALRWRGWGETTECLDQQYIIHVRYILATDKKQKHRCKKMMGGLVGVPGPGEWETAPGIR
jgi:hypothetical protein